MKLFEAFLDGWRVLTRFAAFAACMMLFSLPFALAVWLATRIDNQPAVNALLGVGFIFFLPLAAYLASWYSGEFRRPSQREEAALTSGERASHDEEF